MPPLPTLVCKQCGYVNEGERVYCHGCGLKLDREVVATLEKKMPTLEEKQREVRKIMSPRRGMAGRVRLSLVKMLLTAAVVAAVICAVRPPEGAVPLDAKRELAETPQLSVILEVLLAQPTAQRRALSEKEINAYLRNERFRKVPSWFTNVIALKRVYVNLEEGQGRLTVGGNVYGYPLYAGLTGYFQPGDGELTPVCTGGFIGRLPIHPKLAALATPAVPMVVSSADRDWKLIKRLHWVQFSKEQAVFETQPVAPTQPAAPAQPATSAQPSAAKPLTPQKPLSAPANPFATPALKGGFH